MVPPLDRFGLSVVIPTFDRREPLLRAVASVATRSPGRVEIVVVDDGSPVEARSFLPAENAHGVPLRCFRLDRNRGPQSARNLGIRRARFDFVAFLDSDDTFHAEKVDRVLEELPRADADVLFHDVRGMERYARLARLWQRHLARALPFRWLLALVNPVVTPGLVVRRRRRLGPPGLRTCEDWAFLLRYCTRGTRVVYLPVELAAVHRSPGAAGGLSGHAWAMRRGEFAARAVLLAERSASGLLRYALGTAAGAARIGADLVRGRYARRAAR